MAADGLATQRAGASATMVLTYFFRNIMISAPEAWIFQNYDFGCVRECVLALQWRYDKYQGVSVTDILIVCSSFVLAQGKENIKDPHHWPLWRESTGDQWIPLTKGQSHGKCFHLMTSSWGVGNSARCFVYRSHSFCAKDTSISIEWLCNLSWLLYMYAGSACTAWLYPNARCFVYRRHGISAWGTSISIEWLCNLSWLLCMYVGSACTAWLYPNVFILYVLC